MKRLILWVVLIFCIGFISYFSFLNKLNKEEESSFSKKNEISMQMLELAKNLEKEKRFEEAKKIYLRIMSQFPQDVNFLRIAKKKIEDLNIKLLFSKNPDEFSTFYIVKPGDTLEKIAKKFNTTIDYIKVANDLKSDLIRPNQRLKVCKVRFYVVIDKSQNLLFLKTDDKIIKTYRVSTGKDNRTPTGEFKIINRIKHPTWFKDGKEIPYGAPQNILGDYWLGLNISGYGIHGTNDPKSIGKHVTQGCIRMHNKDIEELYILLPVGTPVKIID